MGLTSKLPFLLFESKELVITAVVHIIHTHVSAILLKFISHAIYRQSYGEAKDWRIKDDSRRFSLLSGSGSRVSLEVCEGIEEFCWNPRKSALFFCNFLYLLTGKVCKKGLLCNELNVPKFSESPSYDIRSRAISTASKQSAPRLGSPMPSLLPTREEAREVSASLATAIYTGNSPKSKFCKFLLAYCMHKFNNRLYTKMKA